MEDLVESSFHFNEASFDLSILRTPNFDDSMLIQETRNLKQITRKNRNNYSQMMSSVFQKSMLSQSRNAVSERFNIQGRSVVVQVQHAKRSRHDSLINFDDINCTGSPVSPLSRLGMGRFRKPLRLIKASLPAAQTRSIKQSYESFKHTLKPIQPGRSFVVLKKQTLQLNQRSDQNLDLLPQLSSRWLFPKDMLDELQKQKPFKII